MQDLKSRLPAPNALLTFEAAARYLSFTRAANELFVTQAAVSRQIRRLEEWLETPLFVRKHRALELTEAGSKLHQAVTNGFGQIAGAVKEISGTGGSQVQVSTTVACATYWFAPLLGRFRKTHPGIDVRVLASDRVGDQLADNVDLALVCGRRDVAGWQMTRLFSEVVFPVCSPGYIRDHPVKTPADLTGLTLLHLDRRHWDEVGWSPVDWSVWLGKFGIDYRPSRPFVSFNNYPMLVEAALAGEGIALGWRHLSGSLLSEGRLVRPIEAEWDFRRSYYLALREQTAPSPELLALKEHLLEAGLDH